ncbi:MAG TPA: VWA domain-containing protein [Bryobacteraceae bacterium]|nr:VWA domain-containing protein [Bryobacteraceae bacterium]
MNGASILIPALAVLLPAWAQDPLVFRSDVSLVRVDAQVVDRDNRAITHLQAEDFVVREDGRPAAIRNFASEEMPVDVLFLLDVSASMRPHVQRIADASGQALTVLGKDDHMAIMVFDRNTRVRLPFSGNHQEVQRAFDRLLRQEGFNGGTDITRAMLDAADYIRREGRLQVRRAIVILTDDQTEFDRDDAAVSRALARADAVMCALIAPDAMAGRQYPGSGGGRRRGGWGSGGGLGGPLGGVIIGPGGGPWGGNRYPRGGGGMGRPSATQSAGTAQIARDSGGDSMSVNDASALEETLMRLRQRYALFFNLPEGVVPGQERNIVVDLSPEARRRYPDAEVRYRRSYQSGDHDRDNGPTIVRRAPADVDYSKPPATSVSRSNSADDPSPARRRRVAVNEDGSPISSSSDSDSDSKPAPMQPASGDTKPAPAPTGGWPKANPPGQQ